MRVAELLVVFQTGKEIATGVLTMRHDMQDKFPKPDIILGQHMMVGKAGTAACQAEPRLSTADNLHITFHSKGLVGQYHKTLSIQ